MWRNKQFIKIAALLLTVLTLLSRATASQAEEQAARPQMATSGAVGVPATFQLPQRLTPQVGAAAVQSADDWTPDVSTGFESDLAGWQTLDGSNDGMERFWGVDDLNVQHGAQSVWVAAGGADAIDPAAFYYPNNLDSWLIYDRALDLRNVQAADVEFSMLLDTEPQYDWIFVGVSTDGQNFNGEYWTGSSGGWQGYNLNLAEYIGQPEVYVAWYFHSDDQNAANYEGVWLDDVTVWTYVDTGPAQVNDAVQNGSFETGDLRGWTVPAGSSVTVTDATNPVSGTKVAYFGGIPQANERFYQALQIPANGNSARLSFFANVFGTEDAIGGDLFCAGLYSSDLSQLLFDLGCLDGVDAFGPTFDPAGWRQVDIDITGAQWEQIKGQVLNLAFEMYTDDALDTFVLIDDVLLATASGGAPSDGNDSVTTATPATIGQEMTELSINPALDQDYYSFPAESGDTLVVDVNAAVNGSALDAYVEVQSVDGTVICANDDDGQSRDAYLACLAPSAGVHYAVVRAYDNSGDRSYTYSLHIQVAGGPVPTPTPPPAPTDTPLPPTGNAKRAWTAILYIDGDNNLCEFYPGLIKRMEQDLGARIGANGFLNVAVLFDRHPAFCAGEGGTQRLLIQPGANYQDNVNRWDMGEVNMGDPRTLVNFAQWAMQNYPAERYYLALDNHGNGIEGIAQDETNGRDQLTNDEVYAALKEITNNGQTPIDIFAYEACLMGLYENAYDIHKFTRYIFAFPTISFASTASYPAYLSDSRFSATTDGRGLGEIMLDVTYNAVPLPMILSLIDASKLPAVHAAVNALADRLQTHLADPNLASARTATQKINSDKGQVLDDADIYLDLWSLAEQVATRGLATNEAATLQRAIESAVLRVNYRPPTAELPLNYANGHGLSIYWPDRPIGFYGQYVAGQIYTATREGRWDDFLAAYLGGNSPRAGMATGFGAIDKQPATTVSTSQVFLPVVAR